MTQRPSSYALAGGLDETSQALFVPKGRVIGCKNHESVSTGYARVQGYERYDGRPSPTAVFSAVDADAAVAARDAARAAIQKPPGSGPIRGVACFLGQRYAWRDNEEGTAGVMYRASPAGWTPVDIGLTADFTSGSTEIAEATTITGATSEATAFVVRVVLVSGAWTDGTAAGYLVLTDVSGTFVGEDLNVGSATNVATIAGAPVAQTFPPGGRYFTESHNFYGATNFRELYGCNGVGRGFAFDGETVTFIRTGMVVDTPKRVRVFKKHLFFAFPGGSVQHSETGEPLQWSAVYGAGEIAVGSEVTDLIAGTDALFIFTEDQISYLSGSDASDWLLTPLNNEEGHGAIPFTAATVGKPLYLDVGGLRSISATQDYGNFRLSSVVAQIEPTFAGKRRQGVRPIACLVTKSKDQYRLFFDDGTGVSVYFGRKYAEPMLFDFPVGVTCVATEVSPEAGERAFFGGADGFVYEFDVGTSFDGDAIQAYLQLPWDTEGSPDVIKRWHKVIVEMDAAPDTMIGMFAEFDYGDGEQGTLPQQNFTVSGGGGVWDAVSWDAFFWSAPAEGRAEAYFDGQGENMSVVIVSDSAEIYPYSLGAVRKKFSVRGQKR